VPLTLISNRPFKLGCCDVSSDPTRRIRRFVDARGRLLANELDEMKYLFPSGQS
jgi:hypothetical protein